MLNLQYVFIKIHSTREIECSIEMQWGEGYKEIAYLSVLGLYVAQIYRLIHPYFIKFYFINPNKLINAICM